MKNVCAVILAAGDGKRMRSTGPKVLCEVLFKPMIHWVADACAGAGIVDICVVLGEGGDAVRKILPKRIQTVDQPERRGTGHAVMMAAEYIRSGGFDDVVVLCGDAPFISSADLRDSYSEHKAQDNAVTVLSAKVKDPRGYGRIVRGGRGIAAIVEERDADEVIRELGEINSGCYWFSGAFLLGALDQLDCNNAQGEYYLTDMVGIAVEGHKKAGAYLLSSPEAVLGANDRRSLQALNTVARRKVLDRLLDNGVNIPFEDGVVVSADAGIGHDTTLLPGTIIRGSTFVGVGCTIGPNSYLEDSSIGNRCEIISSRILSSKLEDDIKIGPMTHVRPGCHIRSGAKIGDFVELKNSVIGEKTSVAHLTYVGDSDVGRACNFGCGVVTVNYDGARKHRTTIGDEVFVGCNTNLIAPVSMGDRSYSAAGTTVTQDVPEDALAMGRARLTIKQNWNKGQGKYKK